MGAEGLEDERTKGRQPMRRSKERDRLVRARTTYRAEGLCLRRVGMVGRRWWMKRQISDGREGEVEVKRSGSLRKEGFHFGISCFRPWLRE